MFARLAAAVAPGGTLLVVDHDASDLRTGAHRRARAGGVFFTADELAASLDPASWRSPPRAPGAGQPWTARPITAPPSLTPSW